MSDEAIGLVELGIEPPSFMHVGILSSNLEASIERMTAGLIFSEWVIRNFAQFTAEELVVGEPCNFRAAIAKCDGIAYEVVQPLEPSGGYFGRELATRGEGMHHLAYQYCANLDRVIASMVAKGFEVDFHGLRNEGARDIYFLSSPGCVGPVYEFTNMTA